MNKNHIIEQRAGMLEQTLTTEKKKNDANDALHGDLDVLHRMGQFDFRRDQVEGGRDIFAARTVAAVDPSEVAEFAPAFRAV